MDFSAYLVELSTIDKNFFFYFIIFLVMDLSLILIFSIIKWYSMKFSGISLEDRRLIFSNRKNSFDLKRILNTYPERTIIMLDGLTRKGRHVANGVMQIILLTVFVKSPVLATQLLLARSCFVLCVLFLSRNDNHIFGFGGWFFGVYARIRDGVLGRKNVIIVYIAAVLRSVWLIVALFFVRQFSSSVVISFAIAQFVTFPLIIGDALGEIVGSLWGKQNIKVWGVGEINKKSRLGTFSVFMGSLVPLLLIVLLKGLTPAWIFLAITISCVSTFVEIAAPRSTDNFCIPAINSLVCLLFLSVGFI